MPTKSTKPTDRESVRKSLKDKISACAIDEYAGLTEAEQVELLIEAQEYAIRWVTDHAKHRISKGSGAAASMLQTIASRLDTIEDRRAAKEQNTTLGKLKELRIVYQEPNQEIVEKVGGQANEDQQE